MQTFLIIFLGTGAAIGYGIVHDQVTARVCLAYFTEYHPRLFDTDSPTLIALGWGVLATWWLGLTLGVALAVAARFGPWPRRDVQTLLRPVGLLLLATAAAALFAGLAGFTLASLGLVRESVDGLPADQLPRFIANQWTHTASYLFAIVGGTALITDVWRGRQPTVSAVNWRPPRGAQSDTPTIVMSNETLVLLPRQQHARVCDRTGPRA